MIDYAQILPGFYLGTYPEGFDDIEMLENKCGITAVLCLQTSEDLRGRNLEWSILKPTYEHFQIEAHRVPMRDFDYEDQRRVLPQAVSVLADLLTKGHTVYLHCNAGVGRSPLVAMAYLYWCRGLSLEEAINHVEELRCCSPSKDLLEVSRQDLLQEAEPRKRIELRAFQLYQQRLGKPEDSFQDWVDAEWEVLREIFC